jgi:hypothetical protein
MRYQSLLIQALFNLSSDSSDQALTQAKQMDSHANDPIADASTQQNALSIYHNNYIENGIRALSITYKTVFAIMDEADFRKLSITYLNAYPKTSFDWADYGQGLCDFMFTIEALASMPFLPELADIDWRIMQIERASNKSFDAVSFGLLQTQPLETLYFDPAPGLQLTKAIFPIQELHKLTHELIQHDLTKTAQTQKKLPTYELNSLIHSAIKSPVYRSIVLWREEYKGLFEYCDTASAKAFSSMLNKSSISDVLSHFGDDQSVMTKWLQQHIQSRKIYAVVKKDE